ncbi:MAG: stage V sporulation protein AC [Clostridia bacterium]|nr:stage V sporulation protein AC [Clostridia bacterium]
MKKDFTPQEYNKYVSAMSPKSKIVKDTVIAFLVGGFICTVAQVIYNIMLNYGIAEEFVKKAIPVTMIFIGAFLTGINVYSKLGKFAGAGTIVPITGFANAVVSSAMEFKSEGLVTGLAVKMFSVAGPVIVYGTVTSVAIGIIYYLM